MPRGVAGEDPLDRGKNIAANMALTPDTLFAASLPPAPSSSWAQAAKSDSSSSVGVRKQD